MASIRKRGNSYHVQIRIKNRPAITASFKDRATAITWTKKTESEIERGTYLDISIAQSTTLADACDRYEKEILPQKKSHYKDSRRLCLLRTELGKYTLASLSQHHVSEFRDKRIATTYQATARRDLSVLSTVLTACEKRWGIALPKGNIVTQIALPKPSAGRERGLSQRELATFLCALKSTPTVRTIVKFALETAMRRGEILNMEWKAIALKRRILQIPLTKTDTPRTIPLSLRARELLLALPGKDGKVFPIAADSVSQAFRRACKRVDIDNLRFHDLRHEATSRLFEMGLSPVEVATITGHRDTRMLMRYTHLKAEDLAKKLG